MNNSSFQVFYNYCIAYLYFKAYYTMDSGLMLDGYPINLLFRTLMDKAYTSSIILFHPSSCLKPT